MRKPIIAGNWKMNKTPSEARELVSALVPLVQDAKCDVVVCTPAVDFAAVSEVIKGTNIKLGAENMHWKESGAFTGELSAAMLKESGVVERLVKTASNELCNIITIFLGISVGATATAEVFLNTQTLTIVAMGLCAFALGTAGGVLLGKLMYLLTGGKVNPLIGSAGVSAVPMAARVSQKVGQAENPKNFLLMHAMGPNVAGVIGSAVAAGVFLSMFMK